MKILRPFLNDISSVFIRNNKWIFLIIALGAIANCCGEFWCVNLSSNKKVEKYTFSILCYNVKCSDDNYFENQIKIANEIIKESPDVLFLCEFNRSISLRLDSIMKNRGRYRQYYRSGANCVFYSKYEIDSIVGINTAVSSGRNAKNNIVHLFLPYDTITIVGCHLSSSRKDIWGGYKSRKKEADAIYKACIREKRPIIVMGDLNDLSCSPPVKRLEDLGLKDAWWEGGCGYGATYHDGWLRLRVDHILYDDERMELVDVKLIDNNLSDHNALMAKFKIKKKQ